MDKKALKERLNEVKKQLRTNAKDTHFFDKLIDEALSLKGQLGVEAIACGFTQDEVVETLEEDTYRIIVGQNASAYQVKGGYTIVAKNNLGLADLLNHLVVDKKEADNLLGEDKDIYETYLSALVYTLNIPMLAATDQEFMFNVATETIKYLQGQMEKIKEVELQDETPKENMEFEAATMAIETLKKELNKEEK